jgi:hypothetical protein
MFFLDAHCHIYPCFSIEKFFVSYFKNLQSIQQNASVNITLSGIILTETNDCNFYQALQNDASILERLKLKGFEKSNDCFISTHDASAPPLKIYPGRQVSSTEKIEVLALLREEPLPENLPFETLLEEIRSKNGLPVINWAPGKWSGKRGRHVESYIKDNPENILLGLTSLLPEGFPYPKLILKGMQSDIPIVYGSDPLPFKGQEFLAGSYGMLLPSLKDIPSPIDLLKVLKKPVHTATGKRNSILKAFFRVLRHEIKRRTTL